MPFTHVAVPPHQPHWGSSKQSSHDPRVEQVSAEQPLNSYPPHCSWLGLNLVPKTQRPSRAHQPHSGKAVHPSHDVIPAHTVEIRTVVCVVAGADVLGGGVVGAGAGAYTGVVVVGGGEAVVTTITATPKLLVVICVVGASVLVGVSLSFSGFTSLSLPFPLSFSSFSLFFSFFLSDANRTEL